MFSRTEFALEIRKLFGHQLVTGVTIRDQLDMSLSFFRVIEEIFDQKTGWLKKRSRWM
jgi:hypothetical protein